MHYLKKGRIADFIVKEGEPMCLGHESSGYFSSADDCSVLFAIIWAPGELSRRIRRTVQVNINLNLKSAMGSFWTGNPKFTAEV